jgi:hypothetical protein
MERWFATGKTDMRHIRGVTRLVNNASQQIEREEFGVRAVKVLVGAKAVAAVQIADVGQLHAQASWTIIIKSGLGKSSHKKAQTHKN